MFEKYILINGYFTVWQEDSVGIGREKNDTWEFCLELNLLHTCSNGFPEDF